MTEIPERRAKQIMEKDKKSLLVMSGKLIWLVIWVCLMAGGYVNGEERKK